MIKTPAPQRRRAGNGSERLVFKRRDARSWLRIATEWIYPRGGWTRAFHYVKHRLRRLPGTPEEIARGIWAGVFTVFTPFFGVHFVVAAIIAKVMRGNMLAALLATFLGNPLTYVPIAIVSLQTGHFLLGSTQSRPVDASLFSKFVGAAGDLWHNFVAMFTPAEAHWIELEVFYRDVFFPWMVGSILPGIIAATVCYYISVPLIRAYQKRRIAKMEKKIAKLRAQASSASGKP
jgi:hypothetical protein